MNKTIKDLLHLAKLGDSNAKEYLINMYLPLIYRKIYILDIKGYTNEDLIQLGQLVILNCINRFDINKNTRAFSSYISISLQNKYVDVLRDTIKENSTEYFATEDLDTSLATNNFSAEAQVSVVDLVITNELVFNLQGCIDKLSFEEKELIYSVFIKEESKSLRGYAISRNIPYSQALKIRDSSYSKIKSSSYFSVN